jgi:hypothetical protein
MLQHARPGFFGPPRACSRTAVGQPERNDDLPRTRETPTLTRRKPALAFALLLLAAHAGTAGAAALEREFTFAPDQVTLVSHDGATEVRFRGGQAEERSGRPDLPWVSERVELPDGQRVARIEIVSLEGAPLASGVRIPTAVRALPSSFAIERTAPDSVYFARAGLQPDPPAEVALQGYEDGTGVALLRVWPVRWDASSGALERLTRLRVRLVLEPDPGHPVRRERIGLPWLKPSGAVAASRGGATPASMPRPGGVQPLQATQLPSLLGSPVEYVIITNDAMAAQMQRLADWKTETGMPAAVRTLSFIRANYPSGTDDADRIRQFIRDAYQRWGTQYVLLGGDTDVLPTRYAFTLYYYGGSDIATDMYYQCLDGNWNSNGDNLYGEGYWDPTLTGDNADLMPEVWVGRAPISTVTQAQQFVDRTLQYEKTPVGDYENSILFFAEVLFPQNWIPGTPTNLDGAQLVEDVLPFIDANPALHYGRLYENYTDSRWKPGALQELKHVVADSLDRGYNLAVHVGHGYRNVMSCGDDNFSNNDALALTNGNRYFNLYAIDCTSNAIDFPCLGEAFLHASGGGAVTNIGSTRVDFPNYGRAFQSEYFQLLFQDSMSTIGEAFAKQKYPFVGISGGDNVYRWTTMTLLLLGDPSLRIWTGRPRTLAVTPPASVAVTDTQLTVNVAVGGQPLYGATVTAYRAGIDFSTGTTDGAGNVTLPFRPDTLGAFMLTVTGYDCRPVELQIPVVAGSAKAVLASQTPTLDDGTGSGTAGNRDGLLDAGETVDIRVPLRNNGSASAPAASAVLSSADGMVNIVTSAVNYGAIAAGALSTPSGAFRISLAATVPDQHEISFTLDLQDGAGHHGVQKFQLVVHGPDLVSYSHSLVDVGGNSDGRPDAGETIQEFIKLRNIGTGTARTVTLVLRKLDALSTVLDSTAAFGDIAPGQEKQGDAVVFVPSDIGARFQLRMFDQYGLVATQTLDLTYPKAPTGLAAVGSGTSVQITWAPDSEADLQGYNVYQAASAGGPYTRVSVTPSDRTSYYQVPNALPLTTYFFEATAVDTSGNESGLSPPVQVITNPPNHAVFPIQMGSVTPSSVAVEHMYDGYPLDIAAGDGLLYVWHSDGTAPVDADGLGTTYGDFTTLGNYYAAGPAIADLNGTGHRQIVAPAWNSGVVYVFDDQGQVVPGWPVSTGAVWSSPTISDLDHDGHKEIIFGSNGDNLYAFRSNGSEWMDGDANPATLGIFKVLSGGFTVGTVAVAPLENNGVTDIIIGDEAGNLYAWRPDGTSVPGFPVVIGPSLRASPAVGYLDGPGDTQLEIVIPAMNDSLYVVESNGARRAGFPVHIVTGGNSRPPSPALADMDRDGKLDIVMASTDGTLHVFNGLGGTVPPWPAAGVRFSTLTSGACESSPVVADINGDHWPDVVIGGEDATLSGFSGANAQLLPGFPIPVGAEVRGTPALCDCDWDGKSEIVLADWDGNLYMWDYDMPFSPGTLPPWPQFHHDAQHTGFFNTPPTLDVPPNGASDIPAHVEFAAPQPNPAHSGTRIFYGVPAGREGAPLEIAIFDLSGRRVRTVASGVARPGRFSASWDLRFQLGSESHTSRVVVLR